MLGRAMQTDAITIVFNDIIENPLYDKHRDKEIDKFITATAQFRLGLFGDHSIEPYLRLLQNDPYLPTVLKSLEQLSDTRYDFKKDKRTMLYLFVNTSSKYKDYIKEYLAYGNVKISNVPQNDRLDVVFHMQLANITVC